MDCNCTNENRSNQIRDFNNADFNWNDFLTGIPAVIFNRFLFNRLPEYFKTNDT